VSFLIKRISPHFNAAYQWNGASELAGDVKTGTKADLPDQIFYVAGADFGVTDRLTLALDFLGEHVINSPRLYARTFTAVGETTSATFPDIGFRTGSFNRFSGAAGVKTNIAGHVLAIVNLSFRLNKAGLRDKVTPLVGIEYEF